MHNSGIHAIHTYLRRTTYIIQYTCNRDRSCQYHYDFGNNECIDNKLCFWDFSQLGDNTSF